ncbi:DUF1801 domain-containing protein [Actinokineospora sp. NBRC 105648]|uniref:DUF1801 domain-containing protein n=1 Tax=Actinokineospora sp. NBRC 105648 TaxID=3032206 RepID=UPI002553FEA4|nr:DUF1801 domain-containing protein [Actinokineospora sp. NBRC 105648]
MDPLESYLARHDETDAASLAALDAAVRRAYPGFEVAVKYGLLMYALPDGGWRHWVCGMNVTKRGTCLRFLYGVLLPDPLGVLRPGTATLMTWDFPRGAEIDDEQVGRYVGEAVERHEYFRANSKLVAERAKAGVKQQG